MSAKRPAMRPSMRASMRPSLRLLMRSQRGELRAARGRWIALLSALCLSVAAVVALAQAGERLRLAMAQNYLATAPAHAQLLLEPGFDPDQVAPLMAELNRRPGVQAARLGITVQTRLRVAGDGRWLSALLFTWPSPSEPPVARGRAGEGPPPQGQTLWIERDAARLLHGQTLLETSDGQRLQVVGQLHDPALAPASTEGVVYGYLDAAVLAAWPGARPQQAVLLRLSGVEDTRDQARADADARAVANWLDTQGLRVRELRVPPLAEHPHQRQAEGAMRMLLACALLSAVLCAVTAGALLRGWLDAQRRGLGVRQMLGASRGALVLSSLAWIVVLFGLAAALGLALGLGLGEALARVSAALLNLALLPWRPSADAVAAGLGLGFGLPLVFTAVSVRRWAAQPVAEALANRELHRPDAADRLRLPGPLALRWALRNVLRRRRRFLLSALLLGVAGAVFMGGLHLRAAWSGLLDQAQAQRPYAIELRLPEPRSAQQLEPLWRATPAVLDAEAWDAERASWVNRDGHAVSRAYPDGGHGQLILRRVPASAQLQRPTRLDGLDLPALAAASAPSALVISTAAEAMLDRPVALGERLSLVVGAARLQGTLVGRVQESMSPPTVYISAQTGAPGTHWRLRLAPGSDAPAVAQQLVRAVQEQGLAGARAITDSDLRRSAAGHLLVLQRALAWVALGTALVGAVTLASALGSSVAERRGEWRVLRALGAAERLLIGSVMAEALLVVGFSVLLALAIGAVLDPLLAGRLGAITGQALPARQDLLALPLWLLLALPAGLLASAAAARSAVRQAAA